MHDPPARVGSLSAKFEVPTRLQIELRTCGRQLTDARGTLFDEDLDCFRVSESRTCRQSVLSMQLRRISRAQRRRYSALRVRGGAVEQRSLGEDHHVAVAGSAPRSVKTSNPAPYHEKARPYSLGHELKSTRGMMHLKGGDRGSSTRSRSADGRLASGCVVGDSSVQMRKLIIVTSLLLAVHIALLFTRRSAAAEGKETSPYRIGIVLDVGGRGDKSFNDGAYAGADSATKLLGSNIRFIEPGEGADREAGLRLLAAEGMSLVIGVGFIFTDDLATLAREYPNIPFAGIDYALATDKNGNVIPPPPNVAALKFREEEGSYLVGAMAALVRKSKKVGFVGGMDIPLIHKFEAGYRAGVKKVCPDCQVIAQYAGVTPDAFKNPGKGKELALSQYNQGVEVIFHAAGSTGQGVFEAARATNKLAIGVDSDQNDEAPGHVLTSMIKGVNAATFDAISRVQSGTFKGGIYSFGLKEGGVGYIYDDRNRGLIPDSVRTRVEQLKQEIIDGRIRVPSTR
jgi:basic membrane protein A